METAIAAMQSTLRSSHGLAVTYRRGDASVSVTAVLGQTLFRLDRELGTERIVAKDYLIQAAALILDGAVVLPKRGDTISELRGATTYTHTVSAPGDEPCYSFSGTGRSQLRVHTIESDLVTTT